jgi:transcription elongation factor Elf1
MFRCNTHQTRVKIEVSAKFECSKCGHINQVTVAADRVTGPIVWLAGN